MSPEGGRARLVSPGTRRPEARTASVCRMSDLGGELDALASGTGFAGVVRIDQSDRIELANLVEERLLELSTPARAVVGSDLPAIDEDVMVEHVLSHRSGIGDYLD